MVSKQATAVARGPEDGERLTAGPTSTRVAVSGTETGGRVSVVEMRLDGGWSGPPPHVHDEVEHVWWVLAGEVVLTTGETTARYGPGSCLFVPAGVPHSFSTDGTDGATVLEVDSPRALDGYFRDLHAAFPPGQPPDPAAVGAVMARHDTRALPPS